MFFILVVILHGIQIIALVCMISGPVGTWIKNSSESKEHNFEFLFGSRIYMEKFQKNLGNRDFY
jgi:hypothetical protein